MIANGQPGPFQQEVSQVLRIRNPHSDPVAFKVKTTAPKQYCVRPNSGRIDPGSEVEVQVLLQAMKEDPPLDQKCRDKFLVQSFTVPGDQEFNNVPSVWSSMEQTSKSSIQEKKIRVNFLPADDVTTTTPAPKVNGVGAHEKAPSLRSPTPDAVTPHLSTAPPVGAISKPESRSVENKNLGDTTTSAQNPVVDEKQGTLQQVAQRVASTLPVSSEDLKAQLAEANATIARLKDQVTEQTGLRQRKTTSENTSSSGSTALQQTQQQTATAGVPLQITALLCLLSFLIAYFLF